MCAHTSTAFPQTGIYGHQQPLSPVLSPLPPVFADQLNSTGIPQLRSLNLVPEEEAESEENEDYY